MNDFNPLENAIRQAISQRIREIVDIEAMKAKIAVEEQVRGMIGQITTEILSYVEIQSSEKRMVITVDFKNLRNG